MNAPQRIDTQTVQAAAPSLAGLVFALLAGEEESDAFEARWLADWRRRAGDDLGDPVGWLRRWREAPPESDRRLCELCDRLGLSAVEAMAAAVTVEVELDAAAGRVVTWLQAPAGAARPTMGLLAMVAQALEADGQAGCLAALATGQALASGLLRTESDTRTLPETALRMPLPLVLALAGLPSNWPEIETNLSDPPPLPDSLLRQAARYAHACSSGIPALAIRSGHARESRAVAGAVAAALGAKPAYVATEPSPGFGLWLALTGHLPVLCAELGPGEHRSLPRWPGYDGPVLVAASGDGSFDLQGEPVPAWRVGPPDAEERAGLWRLAGSSEGDAQVLGRDYRHGAARIQGLSRAGRFHAALAGAADLQAAHIAAAGRSGAAADLGSIAELQPDPIPDTALILPAVLQRELDQLLRRCIARDSLAACLGPAARARHRVGVRALLHGPSGTGKSLAAGWLATRLGLPLYRVDLASVTSKYIGETEKNLAQLFARAESAEVVLLFDEADAMFGKRTDVKDSNDRFANAQTNYLLQRIESFEGIVVLTSNSRARFDSAFARRLDAIIEFPLPPAEDRRALWIAHLGETHTLSAPELNRLAAGCDLAGGHVRNAVLSAAASVRESGRPIAYADLVAGMAAEYRKLGKQLPSGL